MKNNTIYLASLLIFWSCTVSVENDSAANSLPGGPAFDSLLAMETGADEYGMRKYVIAYLLNGPNRDQDSAEAAQIQRAHLDNMVVMADQGKLVLAGPFMDDQNVKGIYIFAVETLEEAEALTRTDPAIKAGRLVMELHPWYGSAALMKVNELHAQLAKEKI